MHLTNGVKWNKIVYCLNDMTLFDLWMEDTDERIIFKTKPCGKEKMVTPRRRYHVVRSGDHAGFLRGRLVEDRKMACAGFAAFGWCRTGCGDLSVWLLETGPQKHQTHQRLRSGTHLFLRLSKVDHLSVNCFHDQPGHLPAQVFRTAETRPLHHVPGPGVQLVCIESALLPAVNPGQG
jgi:hypothetical protein